MLQRAQLAIVCGMAGTLLVSACRDACEDGPYCDGNTLYRCGTAEGVTEEYDWECDKFVNNVCIEEDGKAACALPSREPCSYPDDEPRCTPDGRFAEECGPELGLWRQALDCAPGTCIEGAVGCSG